jgi:hypothetical protein
MVALLLLGAVLAAIPPRAHEHASRSFTITLDAPIDRAMSAFGAIEEERWNPAWVPRFAYPAPARDVSGAVFTTEAPPAYWLLQLWDTRHHVVRYVAVDPGMMVSTFDIRLSQSSSTTSTAIVSENCTAVSAQGDKQVQRFAAHFTHQGPHWARAINAYLAAQR